MGNVEASMAVLEIVSLILVSTFTGFADEERKFAAYLGRENASTQRRRLPSFLARHHCTRGFDLARSCCTVQSLLCVSCSNASNYT